MGLSCSKPRIECVLLTAVGMRAVLNIVRFANFLLKETLHLLLQSIIVNTSLIEKNVICVNDKEVPHDPSFSKA